MRKITLGNFKVKPLWVFIVNRAKLTTVNWDCAQASVPRVITVLRSLDPIYLMLGLRLCWTFTLLNNQELSIKWMTKMFFTFLDLWNRPKSIIWHFWPRKLQCSAEWRVAQRYLASCKLWIEIYGSLDSFYTTWQCIFIKIFSNR